MVTSRGRVGEGTVRESGMDMDTLLDLTRRTSKDLLPGTGTLLSAARQPGWRGAGESGCVCVCLSPFAVCPGLSQPWQSATRKRGSDSRSVVSDSLRCHGLQPARLLCPWDSPGRNTGVGCHALLQGIFPTQGSNWGLLLCRQILYCLSHDIPTQNKKFFFLKKLFLPGVWTLFLHVPLKLVP